MNSIVFAISILNATFMPAQFLAGVYGMNFVTADGTSTIPELLRSDGYTHFWNTCLCLSLLTACGMAIGVRRWNGSVVHCFMFGLIVLMVTAGTAGKYGFRPMDRLLQHLMSLKIT